MTAKLSGKGKAGRKVAINESSNRIPVPAKSIWDEVVEKEEQAEKKRDDRNLIFLRGAGRL